MLVSYVPSVTQLGKGHNQLMFQKEKKQVDNRSSYLLKEIKRHNSLMFLKEKKLILDQHSYLDFFSASSQVDMLTPFGHIILIPSQPVFAVTGNTNFIVFGLTQLGLGPTFYHTQADHTNHYTTIAIDLKNSDNNDDMN